MKNKYSEILEEALKDILTELPREGKLQEAAAYMLLNQGKRIRPALSVAILDDLHALEHHHLAVALSLEVLHTASLIHDDLPAIDNDDYRRGKPSCHKQYSESLAILLADYLQTWAVQLASRNALPEHLSKIIYSVTSAYQNVCLGQILDMNQKEAVNFALINQLKTASLFSCGFELAGIQANWNHDQIENLKTIGENFGLVFQLINDFKDCFLAPESTGRKDSSDYKNNKQTAISQFNSALEARRFIEAEIVSWNNSFEVLKNNFNNRFQNLSDVVDTIFLSVHK